MLSNGLFYIGRSGKNKSDKLKLIYLKKANPVDFLAIDKALQLIFGPRLAETE